jgi:hypothetical protein
MDLRRLKGYVAANVFAASERERVANANGHPALATSHRYSTLVGQQILDEIEAELLSAKDKELVE